MYSQKGANVEFASLPNRWFKLVSITNLLGAGSYSAILQIKSNLKQMKDLPIMMQLQLDVIPGAFNRTRPLILVLVTLQIQIIRGTSLVD